MELILNTFGVSLGRENEGFVVTSSEGKQRIPTDAIKSIQISKGVHITSDAVFLAIEKEIDLVFVERNGKPAGRVWSHKFGSISTIRKGQLNFNRGGFFKSADHSA
jgi:CRISPR-associated protein Cas1